MLNLGKFLNKKVIFIFVIVLLLVGGGFFWWQGKEIKGSPEDYVIKETEEGKIVENKKAGLTVKVPEGWIEEKIEVMEGSMIFYSSDAEGYRPNKIRPPLKKGCIIEVATAYKKTDFEEIKKEAEEAHKSLIMKSDEFEMIEVDGKPALKNISNSIDIGPSVDIYLLAKNKLYGLGISAGPEDIERCSQEFDKFLETVSIE